MGKFGRALSTVNEYAPLNLILHSCIQSSQERNRNGLRKFQARKLHAKKPSHTEKPATLQCDSESHNRDRHHSEATTSFEWPYGQRQDFSF